MPWMTQIGTSDDAIIVGFGTSRWPQWVPAVSWVSGMVQVTGRPSEGEGEGADEACAGAGTA